MTVLQDWREKRAHGGLPGGRHAAGEEYSIDEAFADLAGCGPVLDAPLEAVAAALRGTVARELGLTVSVGISLTKTLAKLCSKFRKPDGQTIVRREHVPLLRALFERLFLAGPAYRSTTVWLGGLVDEAHRQRDHSSAGPCSRIGS